MLNLALGLAFLVLMFIGNRLGVKNVLFTAFWALAEYGCRSSLGHPRHHFGGTRGHGDTCRLAHSRGSVHVPASRSSPGSLSAQAPMTSGHSNPTN
jgi:hypothetical protein